MTSIDTLRTAVQDVFTDKADFDEVLAKLDAQIDTGSASDELSALLDLRISLNEAAYDRAAVWEDRKRLLALRPDDLELALAILETQYFWSSMLAERESEAELEAAGAFRLDEADEAEAETIQSSPAYRRAYELVQQRADVLAEAAVNGYLALMREHAKSVERAQAIRASWDNRVHWLPWHNYLLILTALQAQPQARLYRKWEALYLAALAKHEDEGQTKVPTGYFVDQVHGNIHARTAYDALAAITAVENHENDYELLEAKAELQQVLGDYPAAAASQRQLAGLCQTELAGIDENDEDNRRLWQNRLNDATQAAIHCEGGARKVQESHIASLGDSLTEARTQVDKMREEMQAKLGARYRPSEKPNFDDIMGALSTWQNKVGDPSASPSEAEKLILSAKAAKVAASTAGLVRFSPVQLQAMELGGFKNGVSPWFAEIEPVLRGAGLELAGWFQNLQNVEALKTEAPGQLWLSAGHTFIVTAEATERVKLKRCMTEFSDGSIMITADARGAGYYSSGPMVDSFNVFKTTPLAEMIAIHSARLDARLARQPGLQAKPAGTLARAEEIEAGMKRHANAFRMQHGITDPEIRGMNVQHHEFFAAELKRETAERIAQIVVPT